MEGDQNGTGEQTMRTSGSSENSIHGQGTHHALNDAKATLHKGERVRRQARRKLQGKSALAICGRRAQIRAARHNLDPVQPSTKRADDKTLHEKRRNGRRAHGRP